MILPKLSFSAPTRASISRPAAWRPAAFILPFGLACALSLAACSFAPVEPPAVPPLPTAWKSAAPAPDWISADDARAWTQGHWWELFGDPVLSDLARRVELSNQNLAWALANVAQAEALLREQSAVPWPVAGVQAGRQRSGGESVSTRSVSVTLTASWAPDLWGRLGEAVKAQAAIVQASRADLAGARLSAQGSLASTYFALREADAERALLDEMIDGYQRALRITQNRYAAAVAARTDVEQAHTTLANAQASRVALQRSRALYEHAIALLVGEAPAAFSLPVAPWRNASPVIPAGVPAALLLRRPDVASAERAVAAANAQIGVARAAYFPNFTLSGSWGLNASRLGDLAAAPSVLWSLGLSLAENVFDAGARGARVDQSLAAHAAAVAKYRQTALAAMQGVEDQLTTLSTLATQLAWARAAAEAAARVERQLMNSYQAGLSAYTEVVGAQASALTARRGELQLQLQRQQATVSLIQALGGGWRLEGEEGF